MVRYAQNCSLPCNPTVEDSKRHEQDYKFAKDLVMLSEDKLKMRMKSFFNNHLSQLIPIYSLITKGQQSKIFQLENKRNKSIQLQKKNTLQNLAAYFEQNEDLLRELQTDLKKNFQKQIEQMFQKVKASLQTTIDLFEVVVKRQIQSIQWQIKKNISNIKKEMKKLQAEQNQTITQTIKRKMTHTQISKFLNLPLEQVKGYTTIFKMIQKKSPLIRKIRIFQQNFNQNEEVSCEKEIEALRINCDSVSCGDMWNVIQLLKKKRDFNTSFSLHQGSFSSFTSSFPSYKNPLQQNLFSSVSNERQVRELNPEVEINKQKLVYDYENLLKSVEQKIVHNLYGILNSQKVSQQNQIGDSQTGYSRQQIYGQPLAFYLNENQLYRILYQSKQIVQSQFQKLNQKNKYTGFSYGFGKQQKYYEPLNSSSQNQQSSDEDEKNTQEMRKTPNIVTRQTPNHLFSEKDDKKSCQDQKYKEVSLTQKKPILSNQFQKQDQNISLSNPKEDVIKTKNSQVFTFTGQRQEIKKESQRQNNQKEKPKITQKEKPKITQKEKPKITQKEKPKITQESQQKEVGQEQQYESRFEFASQSEDQSEKENDKQDPQKKQKQQQQAKVPQSDDDDQQVNKIEKENEDNQSSVAEQYSEYIMRMKQRGSRFQEEKQIQNSKFVQKQSFKKQVHQQEKKIYDDYQKKLDRQDSISKKSIQPKFERDSSLMGDSRLQSESDEQQKYETSKQAPRYPHNLSRYEREMSQSQIKRDQEQKKIIQEWKRSRKNQIYNHVPKQQQNEEELIQYVSYDYQPENQRQKPYQGSKSIKDEFLNPAQNEIQNVLPQQISRYHDIEQQQRIYQQIKRKSNSRNQSRQQKPIIRKIGTVINDIIIPGFHAFKKHQQTKNINGQLFKKAREQQEFQKSMIQIAIDESLRFSDQNSDGSLRLNKISQIKSIRQNPKIQQKPKSKEQLPKISSNRQVQDSLQEDFTRFEEFFKELSTIKAAFSLQENSSFNFLDDVEQDVRNPMSRRKFNDQMRIRDIKAKQEELDISKQEFSIVVRVLKPVLLTFKSMDKQRNFPMVKLIVGDQTGIAVLYMRYYCEVKPGSCLKLNRCRVCKYRGSYEITNMSKITTGNVLPGSYIPEIKYTNHLSLIRGTQINDLSYEVRQDFNDVLRDCVRDMLKNGNQREQFIRKPLILTVCDANVVMKRYQLGDYTGRIVAQMTNCTKLLAKHETVLIKNIRICIRGDQILLVGQRSTVILKADFNWKFKHDLVYIPKDLFRAR